MNDDALTFEQTAALWALDFDVCCLNVYGTTETCNAVAGYEIICAHCDYTRPLCQPHAAGIVKLINHPDGDDIMPIWKCDRCQRRSFTFGKVFHLHLIGGAHRG